MREILFRGKQTDKDKWIHGVPVKGTSADESEILIIESVFKCDEYACRGCEFTPVTPSTVGQYTGLTDKNGNRIFEGDIVEAYDESYDNGFADVKGKVFFNCGAFAIDVEDVGYIPLYSYGEENIEVIGNIHDNPELLKGGEV